MNYLGIDEKKLHPVVDRLNDVLACYHVYYQNLRCHHWYVEGENFYDLHVQFEGLYNKAKVNIDAIAERILTLRFLPLGKMSDYLSRSKIEECGRLNDDTEMIEKVISDHAQLIHCIRSVIKASSNAEDEGTIDLMSSILCDLEKMTWQLDAWTSKSHNNIKELA